MSDGTATLCAIMKDEKPYLLEWIAFHKCVGFDRILIYDNGSQDGSLDLLHALHASGDLVCVEWPDVPGSAPQIRAYNDALQQATTEWICFLDADEFLNLKTHQTVRDFLQLFPPEVSAVAVNWRIFGSSGHARFAPGLVVERFTRCSKVSHHINRHFKTIARAKTVESMHIHSCQLRSGQYVDELGTAIVIERLGLLDHVSHRHCQINHYVIKSWEEFEWKRRRGNANRAAESPDKFARGTVEFFKNHDTNDEADLSICRFLPGLQKEMARLQGILGQKAQPCGIVR